MSTAVIHASEGDHEVSGVDDGCGVGSEAGCNVFLHFSMAHTFNKVHAVATAYTDVLSKVSGKSCSSS